MTTQTTAGTPAARRERRMVMGIVASDKADKTIKVLVQREFMHQKYEKRIRRRSVYVAHDEKNEAKCGDLVELRQVRRLSKTKFWSLVRVVKAAGA